jgi:hypothetical protein
MEVAQIDFQQLRIKHILYKSKVRSMLYGGAFDASFFSPSGPVNMWFQTVGRERYSDAPEIAELIKIHNDLNVSILALHRLYSSGNIDQAHEGFKNIENKSDEFLQVLERLDARLQRV